jgi:hypothetical protein
MMLHFHSHLSFTLHGMLYFQRVYDLDVSSGRDTRVSTSSINTETSKVCSFHQHLLCIYLRSFSYRFDKILYSCTTYADLLQYLDCKCCNICTYRIFIMGVTCCELRIAGNVQGDLLIKMLKIWSSKEKMSCVHGKNSITLQQIFTPYILGMGSGRLS